MGLAGVKVKQRFGFDPRNTKWANDTERFGLKYLEKQGWKQGTGLGQVTHAVTSHVKVAIKDDTVGLGAKLAKKQKKDEFDSGECAGLDVFQRILGRLNGKEDEINKELEIQRKEKIINGKWGMHFVMGETLKSTWNAEAKKLTTELNQEKSKKRSRADDEDENISSDSSDPGSDVPKKKFKKEKKEKKEKNEKNEKKSKKDKKEKKDKKDKKEKKEKKEKKSKKDKKNKDKKESEVTRESMLAPNDAREESPAVTTRLHVRSKWIRQKRAATMDAKALNEIFMISN
ncbi:Protein PXR1 [Cyberlindnera fabianii]|uniref:Protein PXR1 n=1 Tax=Cyberlindnera fabianii TaxID=36022 RepID=A0A1V2L6Y6_CYBFA|nr:Protein PXR1 [Cyberlindnera fabianii]